MLFFLGVIVAVAFAVVFADEILAVVLVAGYFALVLAGGLLAIGVVLLLGVSGWDGGWTQTALLAGAVLLLYYLALPVGSTAVRRAATEQSENLRRAREKGMSFSAAPLAMAALVLYLFRAVLCLAMPFALGMVVGVGDALATKRSPQLPELLSTGVFGAAVGAIYFATARWRR